MDILISDLTNQENYLKFANLIRVLAGATLLYDKYRFEETERKCIFELTRYYIEKPIKENQFLFIRSYRLGEIKSIIEVFPVLRVEETSKGYEDFEMEFDKQKNILRIGTYRHSLSIFIAKGTKIRIYDVGGIIKDEGRGYYPARTWIKLNSIIKEISST